MACELVFPKCEPVSESGYEHFQEEEFYGQRLPPQLGAFGLGWPGPETKYPRDATLMPGSGGQFRDTEVSRVRGIRVVEPDGIEPTISSMHRSAPQLSPRR
jgi:hypothetical protein